MVAQSVRHLAGCRRQWSTGGEDAQRCLPVEGAPEPCQHNKPLFPSLLASQFSFHGVGTRKCRSRLEIIMICGKDVRRRKENKAWDLSDHDKRNRLIQLVVRTEPALISGSPMFTVLPTLPNSHKNKDNDEYEEKLNHVESYTELA